MDWFTRKLRAVDDAAVERQIRYQLQKHPRVRHVWIVQLLVSFILSGYFLFIMRPFLNRMYALLVASGIAMCLSIWLTGRLYQKRAKSVTEDILHGLNRCTGCGYQLAEGVVEPCPECGLANGTAG